MHKREPSTSIHSISFHRSHYTPSKEKKKAHTVVLSLANPNTTAPTKQTMTANSKNCVRRNLGVLLLSQVLCLARADGNKPNGWDSVLDRIKTDLNSNGGADKPSSVLRGTERELKHSNSKRSGSRSHKPGSQPEETREIVAVSQMSLDGMTVEECLAMSDFMSKSCTDCSIMFNKMELASPEPLGSNGAVFLYNPDAYYKVYDNMGEYQSKFPLTCKDYPVSNDEKVMTAVQASNSISVRDYKSPEMSHCIMDIMHELGITELPPNPPCPNGGTDGRRLSDSEALSSDYWPELAEVLEYQKIRMKYGDTPAAVVFPAEFPLPDIWTGYTVNQVAIAVFDEPPCYHQARFFHQVFAGRYGVLEQDYNVKPAQGGFSEFVEGIIAAYSLCIDAVQHIGEGNFALKWSSGRARPEEVFWIIYNCLVNNVCDERLPMEFVPQSIKDGILEYADEFAKKANSDGFTPPHRSGTVTAATHFTAYLPGCPVHPSYPAMHSAASNWGYTSQIIYNATPQMTCEALKVDYAVSKARTVAGVHFKKDNTDGLNFGQAQAARFLDYYFMERGGDIEYIRNKIAEKRFDWREVDMSKFPADCTQATAADLANAGVSSFANANSDRFGGTSDGALPQAQFSAVAGNEVPADDADQFDPFDPFLAFDFGYECSANNPWAP